MLNSYQANSRRRIPAGASLVIAWTTLMLFFGVGITVAQVLYGSLTGNVTDPSGAVVANAKVNALNVATGITHTTNTDSNGVYRVPDLQEGTYKVSISAQGFTTVVLENVGVLVNNVKRADAQLQVAQAQTVVEVNAAQETLQTDKADVHLDLTSTEISNLPITSSNAGRNFQSLLRVVPGFGLMTEQNSAAANPQRAQSTNVNGQSLQGINTRIDGVSDQYPWLPGNVAYVPPAEAIETVNVATNAYDAEQGMAGGAAVNVQIKTGTNQFHGEGFEFFTDQLLRARNYFQTDPVRFPRKAKNILNQFGGTFGGPIVKDKLFFFGDYQRTTQRGIGTPTETLPTAAERTGDFRNTGVIIYDPATGNASGAGRQEISCNGVLDVICPNRIDPAAAKLVSLMPALTSPNALTNNYVAAGNGLENLNTFDVKVNYNQSEKSALFARYSFDQAHIFDPPALGPLDGDATNGGQLGNADNRTQNVGVGGTYTFSPTLLFDWNIGFTRLRLGATAPDIGTPFGTATLGIPGTNGFGTTGDPTLYNGIPAFQTTSMANLGNTNTGNPFLFRDNQYVTGENLSWNHGKHAFRFGFEYDHTQMNHFQPQGADGTFTTARGAFAFNGNVTSVLNANNSFAPVNPENSFAQLLLGLPNRQGKATLSNNPVALRWTTWAWYARDQWQFNPKLTLTLGVRWEFYPFGYSDNGRGLPYFNPTNGNVYIGGAGGIPGDSTMDVGGGRFLPRVGLAYRLTEKTVVRAGYGISDDPNQWHFDRNAYPATITTDFGNTSGNVPVASLTGTNSTAASYGTLPVGLAPVLVAIPNTSSGVVPLPTGAGTRTFANPFRRGYIESYNFTLQREFTKSLTAEAGFVGALGVRPLTNVNLNASPICPASVVPYTAAACSAAGFGQLISTELGRSVADISALVPFKNNYYDSLQIKATQRLGGASFIGLSYTFSKAIDYSENEDLSGLFEHYPAYWNLNKALAAFDRTHNLQVFGLYELPFGRGKKWAQSGVGNALAGGWQVNYVVSRLSGTPFNLTGNAALLNPGQRGLNETVNLTGTYSVIGGNPWSGTGICPNTSCDYFNPAIFSQPTIATFGDVRRDTFRGPGIFTADMSVFRNFKITERFTFQFRTEIFGLTNTPRFSNPNGSCAGGAGASCLVTNSSGVVSNNFGSITSTLGTSGSGASTDGARQIWFAGKIIF